jgi:transposase
VLTVEDWAEIRRLHRAEGLSIKEIVRLTGVSRNTVRAAVRSDSPPVFHRQPALRRWIGSRGRSGGCCRSIRGCR